MSIDHLDWALCRSFLAIVRGGSLSAAARRLGVAHPTVRRHLDALESALGAPLFVRSPSGLVPTELAEDLKATAEAMEVGAEAFVRTASAEREAVAGTVRITAMELWGAEVLPPILAALQTMHPRLTFELTLTRQTEDLLRREADIAVRMAKPAQDDLIARRIGPVSAGLYAHETWLARHGVPASLRQLADRGQLVGFDRNPAVLRALTRMGVAADRGSFAFRSDNDLAQLAAIRAGMGVGICHAPIAARDARLVRVLPAIDTRLDLWLAASTTVRAAARVRATFDALARDLGRILAETPPSTIT